ncbi:MAG: hypothetical protein GY700_08710, partial [Propionibacteriaceae bacterium]|nr:hypothetical protein [Propionibacteriaceae bacterium]
PTTGQIISINLTADDPDEDMGIYTEGSIGDTVWCDVDGNGLYNAGEGVDGVTVDLYQDTDCDGVPDGSIFLTEDTTGDGQYLFDSLSVGLPGGPPVCYYADVDEADMGACDNPFTPITYSVLLEANNPNDLTVDFGFSQLLILGNFVWYDTNQDGIQDAGEAGIGGVVVELL